VLAETGQEPALAKHMPNGAIRWRAENDKQGYEDVAPISPQARAALERYLRTHPRVGDVWIFPQSNHPDRPTNTVLARHLLVRAEARAELPHVDRGAFHAYRRRVIENESQTRESGHTSDTPSKTSSGSSTA